MKFRSSIPTCVIVATITLGMWLATASSSDLFLMLLGNKHQQQSSSSVSYGYIADITVDSYTNPTTVPTSATRNTAARTYLSSITMTENGTVDSMRAYWYGNAASGWQLFVYADNGSGTASTEIISCALQSSGNTGWTDWITLGPSGATSALVSGTTYWIGAGWKGPVAVDNPGVGRHDVGATKDFDRADSFHPNPWVRALYSGTYGIAVILRYTK